MCYYKVLYSRFGCSNNAVFDLNSLFYWEWTGKEKN